MKYNIDIQCGSKHGFLIRIEAANLEDAKKAGWKAEQLERDSREHEDPEEPYNMDSEFPYMARIEELALDGKTSRSVWYIETDQ